MRAKTREFINYGARDEDQRGGARAFENFAAAAATAAAAAAKLRVYTIRKRIHGLYLHFVANFSSVIILGG